MTLDLKFWISLPLWANGFLNLWGQVAGRIMVVELDFTKTNQEGKIRELRIWVKVQTHEKYHTYVVQIKITRNRTLGKITLSLFG